MAYRPTGGFTLIELLVVIAIIGILAAILFPVFARAKDCADTATCVGNMQQIYKATMMYASDYDGYFPTMMGNWWWPDEPVRNRYRDRFMDVVLGPYLADRDVLICPMWRRNEYRYDPPLMFSPWWPVGKNFAIADAYYANSRPRPIGTMLEPAKYNLYICGSINNHGRVHDRQIEMKDLWGTVVCKGDGSAMLVLYHKDFCGHLYWDGGYGVGPDGYVEDAFVDNWAY